PCGLPQRTSRGRTSRRYASPPSAASSSTVRRSGNRTPRETPLRSWCTASISAVENADRDIDAPLAGRNRAGGDPHGNCEAAQGRTEEHPQGDHRRQEEADDRSFAEEDPDGAWEAGRRRGQAEAERRLDAAHTERA